ncbi:Vegetative incompatibility protein HET-E-1 [Rhizoctonia solani]|uniref:Vegetative incompatibility protein HET-E-1 n=1 Tax=Rhizoctonia solani TaxID=456999 RepID=A0A8H8SYE1_9AGAM|nr:Vegetative incompatibility protein HET-E-1 [Rhizoctonia solani]QRW22419.1 Vegetative incompatibility protein HET-E-1 [Rhizoctonia solani]
MESKAKSKRESTRRWIGSVLDPASDDHGGTSGEENTTPSTSRLSFRIPTFDRLSGAKGGAWAGLRVSLKTLRETPAMFGPVVSAASILLDCLDTIEAIARNQRDYEYLATELGALSKSLATTYKRAAPGSDSDCVTGIAKATEREAKETESKTERRTGRRMLMANADQQDLMKRCKRIESLFRQLQTNVGMSTWANTNELVVVQLQTCGTKRADEGNIRPIALIVDQQTDMHRRHTVQVLHKLKGWVYNTRGQAAYWMSGMTGTGKTTFACTFAEWLEREAAGAKLLLHAGLCRLSRRNSDDTYGGIPAHRVPRPIPALVSLSYTLCC